MASRLLSASRVASYLRISVFHRGFSSVRKDMKYSNSHEWVKIDGNLATVGMTHHVICVLSGARYVDLPYVGDAIKQGDFFGAVECGMITSDVMSPISGKVVEVNEELYAKPGLLFLSPYEDGWFAKVEIDDADELKNLKDPVEYSKYCGE